MLVHGCELIYSNWTLPPPVVLERTLGLSVQRRHVYTILQINDGAITRSSDHFISTVRKDVKGKGTLSQLKYPCGLGACN